MKFILRKLQEDVYELVRVLDNNEEHLIASDTLAHCVNHFRKLGVPDTDLERIG